MTELIYLIPLLPLLGFLINGLGWRIMPKSVAGWLASLAIVGSFLISLGLFFDIRQNGGQAITYHLYDFINVGNLNIPFEFLIDPLSSLFLLIITGIGSLIHIYSISYMHDDEGMVKYFAYLNLFVFFMLLLVMGNSYALMFVGWEGVGLCSYLLIGFWYKNYQYTQASKKAFVMNRIGDLGFLVGMFLTIYNFGTLSYDSFFASLDGQSPSNLTNWIALCFFIGATGKSAQLPLFTWLPDAMAGPTPVSALIHAATMVTAGIYMIARSHALYTLAPVTLNIIAVVGALTALLAASVALKQNDIKKVLAYSTVSQLGFMFIALGTGAYTTAVFHVMTHAFFKALLFLGSGSVIHAMGGEQDIRYMGGLKKQMPITHVTFLIGCLAISGIPFFSGFFSKDEIMAYAFAHNPVLYAATFLAAMMTAFYMFRLYFLTFTGSFRGTEAQKHHLHESPALMTIPLVVLAVLSIIGGYVGLPAVISENHTLNTFLSPNMDGAYKAVVNSKEIEHAMHNLGHSTEWILMGLSVIGVLIMIAWANKATKTANFPEQVGLNKVLEQKWYVDELYNAIIFHPLMRLGHFIQTIFDSKVIDGAVNGIGKLTKWGSDRMRLMQNGMVGTYLFIMVIGAIAICAISFFCIYQ